jgi:hypothetical protein
VLTATLLWAGDQIRLSTQLIEAPSSTLLHSMHSQAPLRDLFRLQDELARHVVELLSIRLSPRDDRRMKCDVPASPSAYEYYFRGGQSAHDWKSTLIARDLYLQCIERDPRYAAAWARLARCYRISEKYGPETGGNLTKIQRSVPSGAAAESGPVAGAHPLHLPGSRPGPRAASHAAAAGSARGSTAMTPSFTPAWCMCAATAGLLTASLQAHQMARRIDPQVPTSVAHTYFMGDYQRAAETGTGGCGSRWAISFGRRLAGGGSDTGTGLANRK